LYNSISKFLPFLIIKELAAMPEIDNSTSVKIKEEARKLFEKKGFNNTTIDEICLAAGVTKTTFYYHFKSKKELTGASLYHQPPSVESSNNLLIKMLGTDSEWKKIWWLSVDALLRCNHTYKTESMKKVIAESMQTSENFFADIPDEHFRMMEPLIIKAQEKGEVKNLSKASSLVYSLYDAFIGAVIIWCTHPGGSRLDLFKSIMHTMEDFLEVDSKYKFELTDDDLV